MRFKAFVVLDLAPYLNVVTTNPDQMGLRSRLIGKAPQGCPGPCHLPPKGLCFPGRCMHDWSHKMIVPSIYDKAHPCPVYSTQVGRVVSYAIGHSDAWEAPEAVFSPALWSPTPHHPRPYHVTQHDGTRTSLHHPTPYHAMSTLASPSA